MSAHILETAAYLHPGRRLFGYPPVYDIMKY